MVVKYSKVFTFTGAITCEPVTILVERVDAEGFQGVSIESLEGEYLSQAEFNKATERVVSEEKEYDEDIKVYNFLPMKIHDTHTLVDTLNEALAVSQEG